MKPIATFAAGCFWRVEDAFRKVHGVSDVVVGYTGGHTEDPTYDEVCTGETGHAESVQIEFDPEEITYEQLLKVFWMIHDATQVGGQGPDIGSQYRSAIFYHDDTQKELAEKSRDELQAGGKYDQEIVTSIEPAGKFYPAEDYHQQYLAKVRGEA